MVIVLVDQMYQEMEVWAPLYRLIEAGAVLGGTDEFGFSPNEKFEVYDIQATLLHLLGIDHLKLTHRF